MFEKKATEASQKTDAFGTHTIALRDKKRTRAKKERDRANDNISKYTMDIKKNKKKADDVFAKHQYRIHGKQAVQRYTDLRETEEFLRDYWDEEIDRLSAMS